MAQGQNNACQSVIAHDGAARETATPILPSSILIAITTVANAGDSIRLPAAKAGMVKMVLNATANSANIYGYRASDAFNGVAGDPFAIDGNTAIVFSCPKDGLWAVVSGGGGGGDEFVLQLGGLNLQLGGLTLTLTVV